MKIQTSILLIVLALGLGFGGGVWVGKMKSSTESPNELIAEHNGLKIYENDIRSDIDIAVKELEQNTKDIKRRAVARFVQKKSGKAEMKVEELPEPTPQQMQTFLRERNMNLNSLSPQQKKDVANNAKIHIKMVADQEELRRLLESEIKWQGPLADPVIPKATPIEKSKDK